MTELTNHKKRMIYDDACDILRKDAYGREDKVEEPEKVQIYDADWFASKFSLTKEEATSLLERLIKDEKLEEVEEDKYKAICRCSICGKRLIVTFGKCKKAITLKIIMAMNQDMKIAILIWIYA